MSLGYSHDRNDEEIPLRRYRVWMRSTPGFYEQYDGKVDVWARNDVDAEEQASMELKRGAFPDRTRAMWKVEKVERLED